MNLLQVTAIVVSLAASAFAVARVVFVTEVKVDQHDKRLDKVEGKADTIDKEVTGPHNARVVRLAGELANLVSRLDSLVSEFREFRAEYRDDQKQRRS